jgi:hypothetical protein
MQAAAHQTRREHILGIPLAGLERARSAAGISETAAEPGGALGIAPSGSIGGGHPPQGQSRRRPERWPARGGAGRPGHAGRRR